MTTRERYVQEALKYVGAKQGDAMHKSIIDLYNTQETMPRGYKMTYTANWCAAFVTAVGVDTGLTPGVILPECSCSKFIELYSAIGRWVEADDYTPRIGDLLIYDWQDGTNYAATDNQSGPDHVGIVVSVDGSKLQVLEGNQGTEKKVGLREMTINGRYVRGYCLPDYESMDGDAIDAALEKIIEGLQVLREARKN